MGDQLVLSLLRQFTKLQEERAMLYSKFQVCLLTGHLLSTNQSRLLTTSSRYTLCVVPAAWS
jgi:hypothetical protein